LISKEIIGSEFVHNMGVSCETQAPL